MAYCPGTHWTFLRDALLLNLNSYPEMKNQPLSSYSYFPQIMIGTILHHYDPSSQAIEDVVEVMMDLLGGYWVHFLVQGDFLLVSVAVVLVLQEHTGKQDTFRLISTMAIYKAGEMGACMEELQQPALLGLQFQAGTVLYIQRNLYPIVEIFPQELLVGDR